MHRAFERGLGLKASGASLVLSPPLVIDEADLDRALDILFACIGSCAVT